MRFFLCLFCMFHRRYSNCRPLNSARYNRIICQRVKNTSFFERLSCILRALAKGYQGYKSNFGFHVPFDREIWQIKSRIKNPFLDSPKGTNEPMNPFWTRIHWFIWSTMIRAISDRWSWSGSFQRNAPMESSISILQWSRRSTLGSICDVSFKCSRETSNWFRRTITRKLQEKIKPFVHHKFYTMNQTKTMKGVEKDERCMRLSNVVKTRRYWNASYF